ncbi:MAG TPA: TlpA disulfide reductase family protein [Opitutaceae bacterium]|jgi:thiol-disulfide isomerase/thioredoxin|nr:TlpA disulfide reductase family protein [Opitutaceae bacterium]
MKNKRLFASLVFAACLSVIANRVFGQATPPPAAKPDVTVELQQLVESTKVKIQAGSNTEASLTEELKAFDALLAEHKDEKTEAVAEVLLMKAMLYMEVIHDYDQGGELLKRLKADFPGTQAEQNADKVLASLDQMKATMKIQSALKPGVAFPDFNEKDLAGEPLSIARFKGKVVLVDFWATWCGPCREELPNVLAAYKKYHDKGFEIIGVSLDQDENTLKSFIKEKGMVWPQYFDGQGWGSKLGQKYGIDSIPMTFLLDQEGKIVAKGLRGAALDEQLALMLGK